MQFSSLTHRALSGVIIPDQCAPGRDSKEGVLHIPQSSSIPGTSPSDCLESYLIPSLWGVIPLWRDSVNVFYNPSWLGNHLFAHSLNGQTVFFLPMDRTQLGATTQNQSEPGTNCNEVALHIPQRSRAEAHHQIQFTIISRTIYRMEDFSLEMHSLYSIASIY